MHRESGAEKLGGFGWRDCRVVKFYPFGAKSVPWMSDFPPERRPFGKPRGPDFKTACLGRHYFLSTRASKTLSPQPRRIPLWSNLGPRFSVFVVPACARAVFSLGTLPVSRARRKRAETLTRRLETLLGEDRLPYAEEAERIGVHHQIVRYAAATGTVLIRWEGARQPIMWTVPAPSMSPEEARLIEKEAASLPLPGLQGEVRGRFED